MENLTDKMMWKRNLACNICRQCCKLLLLKLKNVGFRIQCMFAFIYLFILKFLYIKVEAQPLPHFDPGKNCTLKSGTSQ